MQTGPVMRFMNRPGLCYVIALDRDIHVDITKHATETSEVCLS